VEVYTSNPKLLDFGGLESSVLDRDKTSTPKILRRNKFVANIQRIADSVFSHVDAGILIAEYALAMGALIDTYDDNPDIHAWVDNATGSAIYAMIDRMVQKRKWNNIAWLENYVRNTSPNQYTKEATNVHLPRPNVSISSF
jgi:hypothetical protein